MENTHIENQLIVKYLMQQLSEEESAQVADWIRYNPANQEFLFSLEELYWASRMKEMRELADTNSEWKKLEAKILKGKEVQKKAKEAKVYRLNTIFKYAAIIAVSISLPFTISRLGIATHKAKQNIDNAATIVTNKGERSQLILPDGTKIWINACSSLSYDLHSPSEHRLKLSGEAYFEVAKNEKRSFIVSTSLLDVKVLGTKFNLKAFDEDDEVQTTLYEGSVAVTTPDKLIVLKPGEQLTYAKDKPMFFTTVLGKEDMEWKEGIYHFKKQKLQNIVVSLERYFDVEISIDDMGLAQEQFTCDFENSENLIDILEVLKMTKKLDYSIKGSKVYIISKK